MTLYLCAHKCRGEPTFSIAEKAFFDDDEEDVFFVETVGGHRVYPWRTWPITELEGDVGQGFFEAITHEMPPDARDCFSPTSAKEPGPSSLLASLGLVKKPEPVKRRQV